MKTKNKRNYLREKGITLIALVVTIVVLLILAGVSVNALFGNSGIIEKAKEAQNSMDKAKENDEKQIGELTNWLDNQVNGTTGDDDNQTTLPKVSTLVGKVVDENTKAEDAYGNKITIPKGFKIITKTDTENTDLNYTVDTIDVTKGIVVEDEEGNQFVWIPVGEIKNGSVTSTITLGRYSIFTKTNNAYTVAQDANTYGTQVEIDDGFTEDTTENHSSNYKNSIAKNIGEFCTKANASGGYYIGRYEARTTTERTSSVELTPVTLKANDYVYNYVTQAQASEKSKNMYTNKPYESDLVNSYAWNTAIIFFQEFGENSHYSRKESVNSSLANTGTSGTNYAGTKDMICNVYDMASNCWEWSTETCNNKFSPCTVCGGTCETNTYYTGDHESTVASTCTAFISFRPLLYI